LKQKQTLTMIDHAINQQQAVVTVELREEERLRSQIDLFPDLQLPYLQLGDLLHRKGKLEDAIIIYRQALQANPAWGEIYHNLGNALLALRRFPEALQAYHEVARLMPGFAECRVTAATALQSMGCPHEALAQCNHALQLDPNLAEAHWNRALVLLQLGEYNEGWREFAWRWRKRGYTSAYRNFPQPQWEGEPLNGSTILVHAEQAFGDTIMFSRYLPLVAAKGGRVICECPGPLVRLISSVKGVSSVVAAGAELPAFDFHVPLMSLPLIFGTTTDNVPSSLCLEIDNRNLARWRQRLAPYSGLKVGIAWTGRPLPDPARSCPYRFLASLGSLEGITFLSLQVGTGTEDVPCLARMLPLVNLVDEITDFADTAGLIRCLDLVISIDSAVAHLAGALGVPTWVMLPYAADWRWLLDRKDSPWYRGMRLFRQQQAGEWGALIDEVRAALVAVVSLGAADSFKDIFEQGVAALQRDDLATAELLLEKARRMSGDVPELFNALGVLASREGDSEKARQFLRHAAELDSGYADPLINLGNITYEAGHYQEAAGLHLRAVEIAPGDPRGWQNLGVVLRGGGKITEAFECFRMALKLDSGYATARWNLATLQLLTGDFENGWRNFEARFTKSEPVARRHEGITPWDGSPLTGRSILVYAEQGYGDTIQFVRYLSLLHRRGATVIFESPDRSLEQLMKGVAGVDQVVVRGEAIPPADYQVPLLGLPGLFKTRLDSIPHEIPYITAPSQRVIAWRERIVDKKYLNIGLCWAGRPKPDPRRSCPLALMAPLARYDWIIFHSLQMGAEACQALDPPAGMSLRDDTSSIADFVDTAALISNLDAVISIDSAVAHLAGALGKPVWLLLPFAPDWRWMQEREDSPWYPTMLLFRQAKPGDWEEVMERVATQLGTIVSTWRDRHPQDFA